MARTSSSASRASSKTSSGTRKPRNARTSTRKSRSSKEAVTEKKKGSVRASKKESKVEESPRAKKARSRNQEESSRGTRKSSRSSSKSIDPKSKKEKVDEKPKEFNPYGHLDAVLDSIEKHVGLSTSSMDNSERRQSTGTLALDLVLGGGITAGWYTNFGQEQSCKTTDAVTMLVEALNSEVPILDYWDYEGCLTYDAQVTIKGRQQHLGDLFVGMDLQPYKAFDISNLNITVDSPCGPQKIVAASYKGQKPITRIELEGGKDLEGYKHPVLVCTPAKTLEWKYIEDLKENDLVVVQP